MNTDFNKLMDVVSIFNSISTLKETPQKFTNIKSDSFYLNYTLLSEEAKEYVDACWANDEIKIADALGDLMFLVMRMACEHGLKQTFLENVLIPIMESNVTKPCNTLEEAKQSIKKYTDKGVHAGYVEFGGHHVVFRRNDMKILKGINYVEPKIVI
jgi:NTP pyrophosphatase (non-canonical NTP hydrolase)